MACLYHLALVGAAEDARHVKEDVLEPLLAWQLDGVVDIVE